MNSEEANEEPKRPGRSRTKAKNIVRQTTCVRTGRPVNPLDHPRGLDYDRFGPEIERTAGDRRRVDD